MAEEALFVNGKPRHITPHDILRWHLASFPLLSRDDNYHVMVEAIDAVYTMFTGCEDIFDMQPKQIYYDKTLLLFRLLCCWYIADQYPMLVSGVPVMGGMPIKAKKIGGVHIIYQNKETDSTDLLSGLQSNPWGNKAYLMIRCSVKRTMLRNHKNVRSE